MNTPMLRRCSSVSTRNKDFSITWDPTHYIVPDPFFEKEAEIQDGQKNEW